MAGSLISGYGIGDVDFTKLMNSADAQRIGFHSLTLTEYDTDTKPAIAAGSKVEVNGGLYKFDTEEAISGSPSDGDVYILLVPAGSSITAQFTNTAPTWSDSKQGWYGTGGQSNYRYAEYIITLNSGDYKNKRSLLSGNLRNFEVQNFGIESITTDGYIKLGSIYLQWGSISSTFGGAPQPESFAITFPNNVLGFSFQFVNIAFSGYALISLDTAGFTWSDLRGSGDPLVGYYMCVGN